MQGVLIGINMAGAALVQSSTWPGGSDLKFKLKNCAIVELVPNHPAHYPEVSVLWPNRPKRTCPNILESRLAYFDLHGDYKSASLQRSHHR